MFHILVARFILEANENIPKKCDLKDVSLHFGQDCIAHLQLGDVFNRPDVTLVPTLDANAGSNGVMKRTAFAYIESTILQTVREHLSELDAIYLHLHGASEVEDIGSGDHHILKEVRRIVGPYLPIAVVCDPHGNLCKEYVEGTTLIRSYRESPHTDSIATMRKVAAMLCDFMKDRQNIHSVYRKLPLILGGEQSVSGDEPVRSINQYMDKLEQDPRIRSVSWHVGYIRHDTPVAGCGIVVVPQMEADQAYAEEAADWLAAYVWNKRHEFHYTGLTAAPDKALQMALESEGKPAFITDSGDNVTSGATGWNTYILRQALAEKELKKKILFANICDPIAYQKLEQLEIGAKTHLHLGVDHDEMSRPVELDVTVKAKGTLRGYLHPPHDAVYGYSVAVAVDGLPLEINVASTRQTMCEEHQFVGAGLNWDDYDVIVVKQGYIFPELKEKAAFSVMSLTQGATPQDTRIIPFKQIMRPMYPIDEI